MAAKTRVPSYCLHKPSGRAIVKVHGKIIYLGKHGSDESRQNYARVIADLMAGRPVRKPQPDRSSGCNLTTAPALTVGDLAVRFQEHADIYYRKNGQPTSEPAAIRCASKFLTADHAGVLAEEFSIGDLKAVRRAMIDAGHCRTTINKNIRRIRLAFTWAATEELIAPTVPQALDLLPGLKAGRTEARETKPVGPVDDGAVDDTLHELSDTVRAMVQLQRATGMRPDEVCRLRPGDVDRGAEVWRYTPDGHKTEHHNKRRVILIGPRGQEILRPFLLRPDDEFCFRPSRFNGEPRAKRRYRVDSYRQAVQRACDRAGVDRWTPNRLRHSFATEARRRCGLEAAQVLLGHSQANVTQVYAERDELKGIEAVRMLG